MTGETPSLRSRKSYDTPISARSDEGTLRAQDWLPPLSKLPPIFDLDSTMTMVPGFRPIHRDSNDNPPSPLTPKYRDRTDTVSSSSSDESDETDGGTLWQPPKGGLNGKPSLTPLRTNFKGDDAWLVRPTPEVVYDRLEVFFPGHNLDAPMIDAGSGSSSPTLAGSVETSPDPDDRAAQNQKHRKSIRGIADERKNKLKQMRKNGFWAKADSKAQAVLRRRSTKLWGSKVEELPMHAQAEDIPPVPDLPSSVSCASIDPPRGECPLSSLSGPYSRSIDVSIS